MSGAIRQSELFAGNDWMVLYKAFSQVNLNAYDFDTIRAAMVSYIQQNYPEDFNDWINSSEFVAILDLLAYTGQSLAFRMDINARENFIDIARRRESVLRLARFLSYNSHRNLPASGLVKIVSIQTTDDVYDSNGKNLSNINVNWGDISNSNWYEQWIQIINAALINTNPYGTPLKQSTINSVTTQLYRFNNIPISAGNFPFSATVDNSTTNFDIVNVNFNTSEGFYEEDPNPQNTFQMVYANDGNGNTSINTGFFLMFKQGNLQNQDFLCNVPLENRTISIPINNINDSDVWVQTVNDNGLIVTNGSWTRVGYVPTDNMTKILVTVDNVTYNSIPATVQNIYQVITQPSDQIVLRFGDGRFGLIPSGNIRCWFRISANENLIIQPEDIQNISIRVPYTNNIGNQQTLTLTFSLQETISNGSVSESSDSVRRRAGNVYSTIGRMVSGQDYNIFPSTNSDALKIKAINRVYSGQSRYIDLNDPTGTYQNTNVFSDDGALYSQLTSDYIEVPLILNKTSADLASNTVSPKVSNIALRDFIFDQWLQGTTRNSLYQFQATTPYLQWKQATVKIYSSTGIITDNLGNPVPVGQAASSNNFIQRNINVYSLIKFQRTNGSTYWATVASIDPTSSVNFKSSGLGPIELNESAITGDQIIAILPTFRNSFNSTDLLNIQNYFDTQRTFGIGYNFLTLSWYFITTGNIDIINPYDFGTQGTANDNSWLILCEYSPISWKITVRGLDYIFESLQDVKFFFVNNYQTVNTTTGLVGSDTVSILKYNFPRISGIIPCDILFDLVDSYTYLDGYTEPRRVHVSAADTDYNGQPDNPESYNKVVLTNPTTTQGLSLVFHQKLQDVNGYDYYQLINISPTYIWNNGTAPAIPSGQLGYNYSSSDGLTGNFYVGNNTSNVLITDSTLYTVNKGTSSLGFRWNHLAPTDHRIDPSISNVIDILVLTNSFNQAMINWRTAGCDPNTLPSPPTENQLQISFNDIEEYKMFSDEIIWRPVKFKNIFGITANNELRVQFKVVTLPTTLVSNEEISSRLVTAVQTFFDVNSWDFGETFYMSELIGFIHLQLVNAISSVQPVPMGSDQLFGDLMEIRCEPDQLFFPTLQVSDVIIVPSLTRTNLRIGQ